MKLRDYQKEIFDSLTSANSHDLVQLDTGAGKTHIEAALAAHYEYVLVVAHRNVLIEQCSEKLAAIGVYHNTLSSKFTRKACAAAHVEKHGHNYIASVSRCFVASIDTILSRWKHGRLFDVDIKKQWVIVIDEAHHVVTENKWGLLRKIFPNCRFIGFTATPARTDGESLHVSSCGLFERLVQAEGLKTGSVKTLIERGVLSNFVVYAPQFTYLLKEEQQKDKRGIELTIAGDVVKYYKKLADGKRAIVMCPRITNAHEIAEEFKKIGVPAAAIDSEMTQHNVARIKGAFESGVLKVLCNVDMLSEGFDLPGLECLIMLRKTNSLIAYRQWVGRTLRTEEGKEKAIIIDHVGNVATHGMPDDNIEWNIETPPHNVTQFTHIACWNCDYVYNVSKHSCPKCCADNKVLARERECQRYIDIFKLDMKLVEKLRGEYEHAQQVLKLETTIDYPYFAIRNVLDKTIDALRRVFVNVLESEGVAYTEINEFLRSATASTAEWWIDRFDREDIDRKPVNKFMEIFKQWQQSKQ